MATQNHTDNFGIQSGAAYALVLTATADGQEVALPSGYTVDGDDTNVSESDGVVTFTTAGSTTLIPLAGTAHETGDSAGDEIEANTVNQADL